jgi:hypothetical protein
MKLTKTQLAELCHSLLCDNVTHRTKTQKTTFETGRRKLLKEFQKHEKFTFGN